MFLIISSLRQFYKAEICARAGEFPLPPSVLALALTTRQLSGAFKTGTTPAHDPEGKVLGIVGMGGIGRVSSSSAEVELRRADLPSCVRLSPSARSALT